MRLGELCLGQKIEQVAEFIDVVALAFAGVALEVGKLLAAGVGAALAAELLADKALQGADGDGLVNGAAAAGGFARRSADAPAQRSQGVGTARDQVGALVVPSGDRAYIAPRVGVYRAGVLALDLLAPVVLVRDPDRILKIAHG